MSFGSESRARRDFCAAVAHERGVPSVDPEDQA